MPTLVSLLAVLGLAAGRPCQHQTPNQRADAETVRRVEHDWLVAEFRGDTAYLNCLLLPDYAEADMHGRMHDRTGPLGMAIRHIGHPEPIPAIDHPDIHVHGTSAISRFASDSGQSVDVFAFEDGAWHAYYSQYTPIRPPGGT